MPRSAIAQWTFDTWMATSSNGALGRLRWNACSKLRAALVRWSDPIVSYELEGTRLAIPLSHDLPRFRKLFPEYSANISRIAGHTLAKYPELHFIDIGANVGDTVALLRGIAQFPILCIEGSDRYFDVLKTNYGGSADVILEKAFLDEESGARQGGLAESSGTAHFALQDSALSTTQARALDDLLLDHPAFLKSKLLKIDTDGFDARILRGAHDLLCTAKPLVFLEYDPFFLSLQNEPVLGIFDNLRAAGYTRTIWYDNLGDYLVTVDLEDRGVLEDLHSYYSGRMGRRYADICAFHGEDDDLCNAIRAAEIAHFNRMRVGEK